MRPRFVLVGAVAGALALPGLAAAQGLGDASKKEKQRRATPTAAPAKTYTQEQLLELPPVANEGASPPESVSPVVITPMPRPAATTTRDEETSRAADEERWRARVAEARAAADRTRRAHETLAGMTLVPGYVYADENGRTVIGSIEELQKLTASAKARRDAAEKALEDLLEQARRANVPPGWLR
jgi:hypothetical protein